MSVIILFVAGLALLAGGVLVYAAYRRDLSRAVDKVTTGALTVTTTAGSIEYGEQGPGNGVPVLASHGGGGACRAAHEQKVRHSDTES
jgi:hypothetical protein